MTSAELDELLRRAGSGDASAVDRLLAAHRSRLKQMVSVRMDRQLQQRFDPSDVVQESLLEASRRLPEYLTERSVPFYPWLRSMAVNRLIDLTRRHATAQRRSVSKEEPWRVVSDESIFALAGRLSVSATSPSGQLQRKERQERVKTALTELDPELREILVLKYLEDLPTAEMAVILGMSERTVRRRHRVAIEELGSLLRN